MAASKSRRSNVGRFAAIAAAAALATLASPRAQAEGEGHSYVANLLPPDDYLALRTLPSAAAGGRVTTLPNGTLVDVLEERADGWVRLRAVGSGAEGWALGGVGARRWILCCRAEEAAQPQPDSQSFQTPSGNIFCMASTFDGPYLRCDLKQVDNPRPPAPGGCDLDWGDAYAVAAAGARGEMVCHGDTVMSPGSPVIAYGQVWQGYGFTCRSEPTGLTCFNALRHGFFVSRTAQRVF